MKILLILTLIFLLSCGGENGGEYYGDLYSSPEAFTLTESEHAGGWGRSNCFMCHNIENIHLKNNSSFSGVDINEVRELTITQGESSCASCHGDNGNFH